MDNKGEWLEKLHEEHDATAETDFILKIEAVWQLKTLNENLARIDATLRDGIGNGEYDFGSIVHAINKIGR